MRSGRTILLSLIMACVLIPAGIVSAGTYALDGDVDTSPVIANFDVNDFPDPNFRAYIQDLADTTKDGKLTQNEADKITQVGTGEKSITTLKGIEYFRNLIYLNCDGNSITSLDLSKLALLETLYCQRNDLDKLNISSNLNLKNLYCGGNDLTYLDLKKNTNLNVLDCGYNHISSLNLSSNKYLTSLTCDKNSIKVLDLTNCPFLSYLDAQYNEDLSDLKVTGCKQLQTIDCQGCKLSSINLSELRWLTKLNVNYNNFSKLDFSTNPFISEIQCRENSISSLTVKGSNYLKTLYCDKNKLTQLDLSGCYNLISLKCFNNSISNLNIGDCSELEKLDCKTNKISKLNISDKPKLLYVYKNGDNNLGYHPTDYYCYSYYDLKIDYYLAFDCSVALNATEPAPEAGLEISEKNFPDPVFREFVKTKYDKSGDGYLSKEEIFNAWSMDIRSEQLVSLDGIKYLTGLRNVVIESCPNLHELDVSGLKNLASLSCSSDIEYPNINGCSGLRILDLSGNREIKRLELADCPDLKQLRVNHCTYLQSVDLSACKDLGLFIAHSIYSLRRVDIRNNPALVKVFLEGRNKDDSRTIYREILRDTYAFCVNADVAVTYKDPDPTPTPVVKISLNKKTANVVSGSTMSLKAAVTGSKDAVSWKSSDKNIATVDKNGKITAKMAGAVTITASVAGKSASCKVTVLYKDVTNSDDFWYAPTNYLTAKGVVKGYANQTEFRPDNECSRAQMVTFLYRLQGEPKTKATSCKFTDVKSGDYFYKPVIWAEEQGITTVPKDKKFNPQGVCTRAQTVTFLWRMAGKPEPGKNVKPFDDVKKADYFYKATLWASGKKILAGYDDNTFRPQGKCLRRQMVTFLYKYDKYVNGKG